MHSGQIDFGVDLPAVAWRFQAVRLRRGYGARSGLRFELHAKRRLERVTRLELATSSLARRCSTTELHPQFLRGNNNVQRPAPCNLLIASASLKLLNPNSALSASYDQSTSMKKLILLCICSMALASELSAQISTPSHVVSREAAA